MSHSSPATPTSGPVLWAIGLLLAVYVAVLLSVGPTGLGGDHGTHSGGDPGLVPHTNAEAAGADVAPIDEESIPHDGLPEEASGPHAAAVLPFVLLLAAIATFPLFDWTQHWWESNRNRFLVAASLALVTLAYYALIYPAGGLAKVMSVLDHAFLGEYVPFIVLLFSLYTICGGIRIQGDLVARPSTNVAFLLAGGLLASLVGTTGAAMLLIRPLIETNQERKHIQHTVVFFIFVVCNCGGCLLPIGDPPLFLGYLKGVNFLWTLKYLWWPWLLTNALILLVYWVWDSFFCFPKESSLDLMLDERRIKPLRIRGLNPNLWLLAGVVLSVALLDPTKQLPGTTWHPWPYLREGVQLLMVFLSLLLGKHVVREENRFNYHAIVEVAALFVGIFICMQPAIEILHQYGGDLNLKSPQAFFWATGSLSAVLDNAPTYVVFFETAAADPSFAGYAYYQLVSSATELGTYARELLIGISLGSVFMGAMTYIGNGPNFMVRAIAEQSGVPMPSFMGYTVRYSIPILIPIFILITLVAL